MWLLLVTTIASATLLADAGYLYNPPHVPPRPQHHHVTHTNQVYTSRPHDIKITQGIQEEDKSITYSISYKDYVYLKKDNGVNYNTQHYHSSPNYNNVQSNEGILASHNVQANVGHSHNGYAGYSQPLTPAINYNINYGQSYLLPPTNTQNHQHNVVTHVDNAGYSQVHSSPASGSYSSNYVQTPVSAHHHTGYTQTVPAVNSYNSYSTPSTATANYNNQYAQYSNNGYAATVTGNAGYAQALPQNTNYLTTYSQTQSTAPSNNGYSHTTQVQASLNNAFSQTAHGSASLTDGYSQTAQSTAHLNNGYSHTAQANTALLNNGYTQAAQSHASSNVGYSFAPQTSVNSQYSQASQASPSLTTQYNQAVQVTAPSNNGYSQSAISSTGANVNSDYAHNIAPTAPASYDSNNGYSQSVSTSASTNLNTGYAQISASPISTNLNNGYDQSLTSTGSASLNTAYDPALSTSSAAVQNALATNVIPTASGSTSTGYSEVLSESTHVDLNPSSQSLASSGLDNSIAQTLPSATDNNGLANGVAQNNFNAVNPSPVAAPVAPIIHKHIYFHVPPPEIEEPVKVAPPPPPPKKNYKILFIKVPSQESKSNLIRLQQQIAQMQNAVEEKTLIYVLSKKPEEPKPVVLPEPKPSEHQVYFVKYSGNPFDIASQVNDELDKTGEVKSIVPLEPGLVNGQHK